MPKVKQFRNLQKSSPQPEPLGTLPSTNAAVTSPLIEDQSASTNSTMSELIKVQPHVVISPSPTNETSSHDSLNSTPSMPTENIERPTTSKKHVGRESSSYWNVNAIDLEGVIKKIKVKVREVNNLPSRQHIVMEFDEHLESGQLPSRVKLYIETRKRKDDSFVNEAAKAIAVKNGDACLIYGLGCCAIGVMVHEKRNRDCSAGEDERSSSTSNVAESEEASWHKT
ncbi:hypothetical protein VIGAN_01169800 [Vigna angularis var. angularis]|uniref:Uncharacterized protein n=1 Tax=Vigna angularis var. angularis TaxID=157739 RepID=A0A0S3R0G6_PHAAN|nr:hypothetical protein VIGAN_01169800 [Vigna angularis var. angularis]